MKKRLIALLLVVATMLSLMGSAAPAVIGEAAVSEAAVESVAPVASAYDYSADVGKYVRFDTVAWDSAMLSADPANSEADFVSIVDYAADYTMVVADWYVDEGTMELWYKVEAANGFELTEDLAATPWVLQNSIGDSLYVDTFIFVPVCDICGEIDCDKTHAQCPDCGEYDCETDHSVKCPICGEAGCGVTHVYCAVCGKYDCGVAHNASKPPMTAPVIPEYTLPEDTDFAFVDGNGSVVGETGIMLPAGKQMSLSAWTHLENASYKWQIRYDHEEDLWVDIRGEADKGILFSAAMLTSVADANGVAYLRCVITADDGIFNGPAIPVTLMGSGAVAASASDSAEEAVAMDLPEALAEDVPELVNYTVVINYVFENNEPAAQSYAATLAAGSNFSAVVTHPTIMGYLPYINNETDTSTQVNVDVTNIQAGVTYTVTYKPTNVNYTVIYYLQNVDNDNYTIDKTETLSGLTNSQVPEVATDENGESKYPGFYALLYERPSIAANGSTVVEVYYDRYYYLMTFDLGDMGYGVEPVYARYGDTLEIGTPTRAGYTFLGWKLNGTGETIAPADMPDNMPSEHRKYTAVWRANDTAKVSVVVWGENANNEEYSYIKTNEIYVKPGETISWDSLSYVCGKENHTHSASCGYGCGLEAHSHDSACYSCGNEEHTHVRDCYTVSGGTLSNTVLTDTARINRLNNSAAYRGDIYRERANNNSDWRYYLKIGNSYYRITFNGWNQSINSFTYSDCGKTEHTHDGRCSLSCGKDEHAHVENCYLCGKEVHTHTTECEADTDVMDSDLWTFVKSDTVTVEADGSTVLNVYYDRTGRTLTFNYDYSNRQYRKTETITAKWGQNIASQFIAITNRSGTSFWATSDSGSTYVNYIGVMPERNAAYYNRGTSGSAGTMTYYGESLSGQYVEMFSVGGVGGYRVTAEDRYEFEGFTYSHGTANGSNCSGATFYYTRNSYNLVFNDGYDDVRTESVKYEAQLSAYSDYEPTLPSAYEAGSREFAGWYLNPECTGKQVDLTEMSMPAENLILYAKWEPVSYKVNYYFSKESLDAGKNIPTEMEECIDKAVADRIEIPSTNPYVDAFAEDTVKHGATIEDVGDPRVSVGFEKIHPYSEYKFDGWFYVDDNGEEKAFDPENMPVTQDLNLYAKWSSNVLKEYSVYFKIQGTNTEIADSITGSGLAGNTKTFDAKGGTDLYADYHEGYFPLVKSHSLTLDIEDESKNTFTFWYVQKDAVPYSVYYVTDRQNDANSLPPIELGGKTYYIVADTVTYDQNRQAVVTETFKRVNGYVPDAYQKRLVLDGSDSADNKIVFFYTADTEHAYYKITHYTQNTDGEAWTEYASSEALGDIGKTYSADPLSIDGFTYDSAIAGTVVSGVLTADGLELKLYYTRNAYPYEVRYLEQGTGNQLAEPKKETGRYGQVISESARDIENYTAGDPTSQTFAVRIEESQTEAKLNIITFYYVEKEATINYVVVGPEGGGTVTPGSENVKVMSGNANGSTATAAPNYRFVGWFSDEACKNPVGNNAKYVPNKSGEIWTDATYYAKFEPAVTALTITKSGWNNIDENQSFIFTVSGEGVQMDVVIKGDGSVTVKDLPIGTYTVTEKTGWSWRYNPKDNELTKTLSANADENEFVFDNTRSKIYWLNGGAYERNLFTGSNETN